MATAGLSPFPTPADSASASEDLAKKTRKPYTITKSRESWTEPEHDKFLEALQLFDRDWKKIEAFIGSKTVIQIRSHAQKYFLKAQKSGIGEHLPPPRPKRKASHPYPQKAPKSIDALSPFYSQSLGSYKPDATNVINPDHGSSIPGHMLTENCCSSSDSLASKHETERFENDNSNLALRVLPDFAQVYSFIGNVCDSNPCGNLQILKNMDPINVETVLLLMRNLSINLKDPDFNDHRELLSLIEFEAETTESAKKCDGV